MTGGGHHRSPSLLAHGELRSLEGSTGDSPCLLGKS
jgi:hypothetical protein